ncbi:AbiH family protein [Roseburia sp. 831b]|uniref:AbiH family protein n=1 Tax=Roseburia sp. 831b TaxID=1261635 RepID=UPI00095196DC|nr:AbiH family protein [Roseburia sp. 831b]WVK74321.1 AbiH family protein [Roseburia sp. 831b]
MEHNILVIGNGFDLSHELNTRYDDFIDWIKKAKEDDSFIENQSEREFIHKCIESNGFVGYFFRYTNVVPGWVDLERLIKEIIGYFELFFSKYPSFIDNRGCISWDSARIDMSKSGMLKTIYCLHSFVLLYDKDYSRSSIHSMHLDNKYYTNAFGLNKREILNLLKKQLDEIIELLRIYLKNQMNEKCESIKKIHQIEEVNPSYVISFNYTDTYRIYGIKPEDVFHVHGSLDKNNMVLGFNDEDEMNLDFVYFKKYFQRIQKLTGYINEARLIDRNNVLSPKPIVYFYGHSMDKTDGDIIVKLRSLARGFVIYIYNQDDYEQKVINLIDVFGKEEATKLIQNGFIKFEPCSE